MREISLADISPKKEKSDTLEKSIVAAIKQIKPPIVNVSPASVNIEREVKEKGTYLITVNRDNHGRVQSMVVKPYEPS